nr:hypothetical protein [Verrucomicrobium spinosum]
MGAFGLVLKHAWDVHVGQSEEWRESPLPDERTLLAEALTSAGPSLAALSQQSPVLVVFLRHAGCTFCREALADIARVRPAIEAPAPGSPWSIWESPRLSLPSPGSTVWRTFQQLPIPPGDSTAAWGCEGGNSASCSGGGSGGVASRRF